MSCSEMDRLWFAATHSEQPGSECDSSWPGPTAESQQSRFREKTTAKRFAKVLLLPIPQSLAIQIWTVKYTFLNFVTGLSNDRPRGLLSKIARLPQHDFVGH